MLDDKQFEDLIRPISNIYSDIEYELLMEIASRFKNYDSLSGSLTDKVAVSFPWILSFCALQYRHREQRQCKKTQCQYPKAGGKT